METVNMLLKGLNLVTGFSLTYVKCHCVVAEDHILIC